MIDKLMKYSKSWNEFTKWFYETHGYRTLGAIESWYENIREIENLTNYEMNALLEKSLIEWLDSKGIYVWVQPLGGGQHLGEEWLCEIKINRYISGDKMVIHQRHFTTRTEATEAGIEKAFELLEAE